MKSSGLRTAPGVRPTGPSMVEMAAELHAKAEEEVEPVLPFAEPVVDAPEGMGLNYDICL